MGTAAPGEALEREVGHDGRQQGPDGQQHQQDAEALHARAGVEVDGGVDPENAGLLAARTGRTGGWLDRR